MNAMAVMLAGIATLFALAFGSASTASADQCNPRWQNQLDLSKPPKYLGNVDTGYSEFYFIRDPRIKLVLKGSFPMVRFLSFQTYTSLNLTMVDPGGVLFDYQFIMDSGSINPYVPGNPDGPGYPHDYTIEILPQNATAGSPNVLRTGPDPLQQLILRFYSPDEGITLSPANLPRVYAHYVVTGRPAPCPTFISLPLAPPIAQTCDNPDTTIQFMRQLAPYDPNAAVPSYLASCNNMATSGQIAVIRFKEPSFVNTHYVTTTGQPPTFPDGMSDVRYWSLSEGDPTNSTTVSGLVDYAAQPADANGDVTVVVSGSQAVEDKARQLGQSFILDKRSADATSVIFVYRNVLPSPDFWNGTDPYPQPFWPTGVICSDADYLAGSSNCSPTATMGPLSQRR